MIPSFLPPSRKRRLSVCVRALFLCAAFSPALGVADSPGAIPDLLSLYVRALDANPQYQAALAGLHEAAEAKPQALAKLLPQVAASGNFDEIDQTSSGVYFKDVFPNAPNGISVNRDADFYSIGYQLGISQVLFDWRLFKSYDKAELQVGQAGVQIYEALDELRLGIARSYFAVLGAQDGVRFAAAEKEAVRQLLEQTHGLQSAGMITDVGLKQAQAEYDLSVARLIEAQNTLEVSLTQLQLLSGGQHYTRLKPLAPGYRPAPPEPNRLEVWLERAQAQNLALQDKHYATEIAAKEIERQQAQRLPTLDANAARQFTYANGGISRGIGADDNHEMDQRVFLTLRLPIYSGGAVSSAIRAAVAGHQRAQFEESAARDSARQGAEVAFLKANAGISHIEALAQAVQSAAAAEQSARVGFDVGTLTYSDVLQSVRARYQAERDYAQARYDYLVNFLQLKHAAGALSHADLLAVNRWLR